MGCCKNLRLYLWKNQLQRRRHACAFCCEVLTPLVFVGLMGLLFKLSHLEVVDTQAFPQDALSQDVFPMAILPWKLANASQKLAVVGEGNGMKHFMTYMDGMYPGFDAESLLGSEFKHMNVPKFSDVAKTFATDAELSSYVTSDSYEDGTQLYAAIVWNSFAPHWHYTIRMNSSDIPTTQQYVNTLQRNVNTQYQNEYFGITLSKDQLAALAANPAGLAQAASSITPGFVPMQVALDRYILNRTTPLTRAEQLAQDVAVQVGVLLGYLNATGPLPSLSTLKKPNVALALGRLAASATAAPQHVIVAPFPITGFKENRFYSAVNNLFSLIFVLCFLYPSFRLIWSFVAEKETRVREGVKMMGMTDGALFTAWYLTYGFIFFLISLGATIITKLGMFQYSNAILVFLVFFLFCASSIAFSFLLSAFFSRSRTAAILGTVVFVVSFFPYFGVTGITTSTTRKLAASLCAPTAFGLSIQGISAYEASGVGLSFANWFDTIDKFSTGLGIFMMLVDFALYTLLGWYFDKVWPSEYGLRKPPYFCCTRSYWCQSKYLRRLKKRRAMLAAAAKDSTQQPLVGFTESKSTPYATAESGTDFHDTPGGGAHVETPTPQLRELARAGRCIELRRLTKRFTTGGGVKVAVDGLDLTIYSDQITCLLGHNGAGKSTTIGMLTGLLPITSGTATIFGSDVTTQLEDIRHHLGVCPQHDVLFEDLTVHEHLEFFAGLKGVPPSQVEKSVTDMIAQVGLVEKTHVQVQNLSGGQRRKCSIAIALIGGSKIVILDEPTSGMDPYSRRSTWSLIQNHREGRIILLTTHFMDEADLLGDRICIMSEGRLQCAGSSHFLKEQYGVGYHLTIAKREGCISGDVIDVVEQHIPDSRVMSDVGAELSFQLPFSAAQHFPALFQQLEGNMEHLGVETFGVGVTTLEEVFLSVAKRGNKQQQELARQTSERLRANSAASAAESKSQSSGPLPVAGSGAGDRRPAAPPGSNYHRAAADTNLFWRHFVALLIKRFKYTSRDKKAWIFQLVIPIAALLLGLGLLKSATPTSLPSYTLSAQQFNVHRGVQLPQFNVMPYNTTGIDKTLMGYVPKSAGQPEGVHVPLAKYYDGVLPRHPNTSIYIDAMSEYLLDSKDDMAASRYGAYVFNSTTSIVGGSDTAYIDYIALQNSTALHATPLYVHIANAAALRMSRAGTSEADWSITTTTHPLPLTARERAIIATASAFVAVLLITIAFAFVPASFVSFLVKEREVNAKHQQLISGVSIFAYWLSTFVWDCINYLVPCGCSLLVVYGFQIQELVADGAFPATALLFLGYGTSVASFTYCLSYLFKSHSSAQNVVLVANLMVFLLLIVSSVMSAIESTCEINQTLSFFWRLLPGFSLGSGLLHLATIKLLPFVNTDCGRIPFDEAVKKTYTPFDAVVAGTDLWYLAVLTIGYLAVAVGVDVLLSYPAVRARIFRDTNISDPAFEEDQDVAAERARILAGDTGDDIIVLNKLRKVFGGKKAAVRDLTFGIPKGQCFGFLGINGAGKTTTLRILSGDAIPTAGSATLGGFDIMTQQPEVRRLLGYCPQFDALLDLLTVREHLELFARIKGVPASILETVVSVKLQELQLEPFEHKYAGSLSGGNKRKLSVAIAMIGDPSILFLDEPSTGMDPVARRFMWDVIARVSNQRKQSTVILTSHSMEEVEALSTRVAIMVGGRLRCLGSIQHLKARFGRGYMAELQVATPGKEQLQATLAALAPLVDAAGKLPQSALGDACRTLGQPDAAAEVSAMASGWMVAGQFDRFGACAMSTFAQWWVVERCVEHVQQFMTTRFPTSELVERHDQRLRYRLPDTGEQSIGDLFGLFESIKAEYGIEEYSLSQTSLETIFNLFAAQQEEERGAVRGLTTVRATSGAK